MDTQKNISLTPVICRGRNFLLAACVALTLGACVSNPSAPAGEKLREVKPRTGSSPSQSFTEAVPGEKNKPGHVSSSQIQIQYSFNIKSTKLGEVAERFTECISKPLHPLLLESISKNHKDHKTTISTLKNDDRAGYLLFSNEKSLCVSETQAGWPVVAGEVFEETISPKDVPVQVMQAWFVQMAQTMTQNGQVRVAYKFKNGNASIARYWTNSASLGTIFYEDKFHKAKEWSASDVDYVYEHPAMSGVTIIAKEINQQRKFQKNFLTGSKTLAATPTAVNPGMSSGSAPPATSAYPARATPLPPSARP